MNTSVRTADRLFVECIRLAGMHFVFQAEDGIRYHCVTGVQTCALPILCELVHTLSWASSHSTSIVAGSRDGMQDRPRSEERRVGKECRSRGSAYRRKKRRQDAASWGAGYDTNAHDERERSYRLEHQRCQ